MYNKETTRLTGRYYHANDILGHVVLHVEEEILSTAKAKDETDVVFKYWRKAKMADLVNLNFK